MGSVALEDPDTLAHFAPPEHAPLEYLQYRFDPDGERFLYLCERYRRP